MGILKRINVVAFIKPSWDILYIHIHTLTNIHAYRSITRLFIAFVRSVRNINEFQIVYESHSPLNLSISAVNQIEFIYIYDAYTFMCVFSGPFNRHIGRRLLHDPIKLF